MQTRNSEPVRTSGAGPIASRLAAWNAVDWTLALYVGFVALVAAIWAGTIPQWPYIVVGHGAILAALVSLPPAGRRGSGPARQTLASSPGREPCYGSCDTRILRCC